MTSRSSADGLRERLRADTSHSPGKETQAMGEREPELLLRSGTGRHGLIWLGTGGTVWALEPESVPELALIGVGIGATRERRGGRQVTGLAGGVVQTSGRATGGASRWGPGLPCETSTTATGCPAVPRWRMDPKAKPTHHWLDHQQPHHNRREASNGDWIAPRGAGDRRCGGTDAGTGADAGFGRGTALLAEVRPVSASVQVRWEEMGWLGRRVARRRSEGFTAISFRVRGQVTDRPTSSAVTGIGRLQHALKRTQTWASPVEGRVGAHSRGQNITSLIPLQPSIFCPRATVTVAGLLTRTTARSLGIENVLGNGLLLRTRNAAAGRNPHHAVTSARRIPRPSATSAGLQEAIPREHSITTG